MSNWFGNLKTSVIRFGSNTSLQIQKRSPEICLGLGIAGFACTVVLACRATLRAEEILDRHDERMKRADAAAEVAEPEDHFDIQKEHFAIWKYTIADFAKLYTPAVIAGGISISLLIKSHNILSDRYLGAVAAYNAVNDIMEKYRGRVRAELGEDMDRHFRYGTEKRIEEVKTVDENGNEVTEYEEIEDLKEKLSPSDYSRIFDESNKNWDSNPVYSMMFLKGVQATLDERLQAIGHLFLNEVYEALGYEHTPLGAKLGWIADGGNTHVDFGLYDVNRRGARRFVNGLDSAVLLEFNVTGIIWDKI